MTFHSVHVALYNVKIALITTVLDMQIVFVKRGVTEHDA